jgi:BlaI family transcriptional regulator, penicillinase repressor
MTKQPHNDVPKLSEMEWEILKPLWEEGPMAARDIFQAVPESRGWAYKTVKTMLARLVKKEVLTYDQIGNSYLYKTKYSREEMTRSTMGSFVDRVFDGAMRPFLAYFAEGVSEDELKVLRSELARIERQRNQEETDHE